MMTPSDDKSGFRAIVHQWAVDGIGFVVAILFFFILGTIVIVATAASKSPWDTLIAAMAMISQAFFAYMVWQLAKNQYNFTRQVTERQHQIDIYPLRSIVADRLENQGRLILPAKPVNDDTVEAFRLCHLEIVKLFSDGAGELAFQLYEALDDSRRFFEKCVPELDEGGSIMKHADHQSRKKADEALDFAIYIYFDLQAAIDEEMRIR